MRGFLLFPCLWSLFAFGAMDPKKIPSVLTQKIEAKELFDLLTFPAQVSSRVQANVYSDGDGVVTKVLSSLGKAVKKGERILQISHTDPVYQYAPLLITSPVDGIVSTVEVDEGTQVTKGQKLLTVTDPTRIKISIEVPAQDLAFLPRGMKGEFRSPGTTTSIPVEITGKSVRVDGLTGTANCELEPVKNEKGIQPSVSPGIIGQALFKANARTGISISDAAVFYKETTPYVRLVENGKAKLVNVELGKKQRGFVEITKGLAAGSVLIERSSRFVAEGDEVEEMKQ